MTERQIEFDFTHMCEWLRSTQRWNRLRWRCFKFLHGLPLTRQTYDWSSIDHAKVETDIEKGYGQLQAMISSMTPFERKQPELIGYERCERIASGSGTDLRDVQDLKRFFRVLRSDKTMRRVRERFGKSSLLT